MFSDPIKNVEQLGLRLGSTVVDLGSGSGHYTFASARAVGDAGKVYAVDIQKDMLTTLKNDAGAEGLRNVEVVWGDIEKVGGTKLKSEVADSAIISNILFQIQDKGVVAEEAHRIVKRGGKLLLVEWSESFGGLGPQPEVVFTHDMAVSVFGKAGFEVDREIRAGEHHYGIIFSKV